MRMPAVAIVLACLVAVPLAGCFSMTVQELQNTGVRYQAASPQSAERAAGCIARNLEIVFQGFVPSVRTAAQPGAWEIVVGGPSAAGSYVGYALATPTPPGSSLSVWITEMRIGGQAAAHESLKGC